MAARTHKPQLPLEWGLPTTMPLAHALVTGQFDARALWMPPPKQAVGKRLGIIITEWDVFDMWFLRARRGIEYSAWTHNQHFPRLAGSVLLAGWLQLKWPEGKTPIGQYRPGSKVRFKTPKAGGCGPIVWVFRKPRAAEAVDPGKLKWLRAEYGDQPEVIKEKKEYYRNVRENK